MVDEIEVDAEATPDGLRLTDSEGMVNTVRLNGHNTWDVWNTTAGTSLSNAVIWQTWISTSTTITSGTLDFTQRYEPQRTYRIEPGWDGPRVQSRHDPVVPDLRNDPVVNRAERDANARALLLSVLTKKQRTQFEQHGFFDVIGSQRGKYRLARWGAVTKLDGDRTSERLCIHPSGYPDDDVLASQKLLVETDEDNFRRIANITRVEVGAYA